MLVFLNPIYIDYALLLHSMIPLSHVSPRPTMDVRIIMFFDVANFMTTLTALLLVVVMDVVTLIWVVLLLFLFMSCNLVHPITMVALPNLCLLLLLTCFN